MRSVGRSLVAVLAAVAVVVAAFAGTAAAKPKYSAKQKAEIRSQLRKQIKKNPALIKRRSFVRKAALVNFVLPVTIRIRNTCDQGVGGVAACTGAPTNGTALNEVQQATAQVNLGPSLGQRSIALGGSLAAEVQFNDTYDGGALGNVGIKILPSTTKFLKTSSVPLLWNPDMSDPTTRMDVNWAKALTQASSAMAPGLAGIAAQTQGCGDFATSGAGNTPLVPAGYNALFHGATPTGSPFPATQGLPGFPFYASALSSTPLGYIPTYPGVDSLDTLKSDYTVGNNDHLGPVQQPFPYGSGITPGGFPAQPTVENTIFRTNALHLTIASPGVQVNGALGTSGDSGSSTPAGPTGLTNGPGGTQSFITGQSGGQANLFGNIPGKDSSIDVTVNLAAEINAIARIVDHDVFHTPIVSGENYPADVFSCHQVWLGAVQNYIPGIRLKGSLRIAPAITKDGKLRIAKATVSTQQDSHVALSACLFPTSAYIDYNDDPLSYGFSDQNTVATVPDATALAGATPPQFSSGLIPVHSDVLPVFMDAEKFDPVDPSYQQFGGNAPTSTQCNSPAYALVAKAGFTGDVLPYTNTNNLADGYTTNASGATVTVAGDIAVQNLNVDVLIGDN